MAINRADQCFGYRAISRGGKEVPITFLGHQQLIDSSLFLWWKEKLLIYVCKISNTLIQVCNCRKWMTKFGGCIQESIRNSHHRDECFFEKEGGRIYRSSRNVVWLLPFVSTKVFLFGNIKIVSIQKKKICEKSNYRKCQTLHFHDGVPLPKGNCYSSTSGNSISSQADYDLHRFRPPQLVASR